MQNKIMVVSKCGQSGVGRGVNTYSENIRTSAVSMGYIGRPREIEIPDLEMSLESLDSLLEREKQCKNRR